jgi:hypothetical protein
MPLTPPALSPAQVAMFDAVRSADNIALLSAVLDDQPVSVICAVTRDGEDFDVTPLYVAVTDDLFARLGNPVEA